MGFPIIYYEETKFFPEMEIIVDDSLYEKCSEHNKPYQFLFGNFETNLYKVIPFGKEKNRVVMVCPDCKGWMDLPKKEEKLFLKFVFGKISHQELITSLKKSQKEAKEFAKEQLKVDNKNFNKFIRDILIFVGFVVLFLILKVYFF
jgi:hypothetical protein